MFHLLRKAASAVALLSSSLAQAGKLTAGTAGTAGTVGVRAGRLSEARAQTKNPSNISV